MQDNPLANKKLCYELQTISCRLEQFDNMKKGVSPVKLVAVDHW
jgi:hypothetical protein